MRFLSSSLLTLLIAASAGTMSACSDSPTAPSEPVTVTLAPGQTETVGGLSIKFTGVTRDTRCPGDAICIQQGDAWIALETTLGFSAAKFELQTNDDAANDRTIGDYLIEVVEVAPYPFLSLPPIQPGDYRVTLKISAS